MAAPESPVRRALPVRPTDKRLRPSQALVARTERRAYSRERIEDAPLAVAERHDTPVTGFVQVRVTQVAHRDPTATRALRNV